ncbi:MAG: zinc ABC transporter substrate-binding protein [Pseudohongiellaceae bacterium]
MKRLLTAFSAAWLLTLSTVCAPVAAEAPGVVATIKPLQLIVSAITDGVDEPGLLIPSNASYHHFTLRPSSMRSLTDASLVVWIGPGLETWLSDVIWQLPNHVEVVTVSELDGLTVHSLVDDALITDPDHQPGHMDPHLWLDHGNALTVAREVTARLSNLDAGSADHYRDNLSRFEASLTEAHRDQQARLGPLGDREYVVYHNAFQYFEHQHGLSPALVFVQDDEIQPGIRQLRTVQNALRDLSPACLLVDVTANPDTIRTVAAGQDLRQVRADTIGAGVNPGPNGYMELLEGVTRSFEACLGGR